MTADLSGCGRRGLPTTMAYVHARDRSPGSRPDRVTRRHFAVLDHDLTARAGELTPTLKMRRPVVYDRYADHIAALYE